MSGWLKTRCAYTIHEILIKRNATHRGICHTCMRSYFDTYIHGERSFIPGDLYGFQSWMKISGQITRTARSAWVSGDSLKISWLLAEQKINCVPWPNCISEQGSSHWCHLSELQQDLWHSAPQHPSVCIEKIWIWWVSCLPDKELVARSYPENYSPFFIKGSGE